MNDKQTIAGLLAHSLLFSIGHDYPFGKKPRAKLGNAFKSKFTVKRNQCFNTYNTLVDDADKVFRASWAEIDNEISISIASVIYFMVVQKEELFKPYKINKKHLEALSRASNVNGLAINSLRVAKSLISKI